MLLHLLQTLGATPTLAMGMPPPDLLHPSEQAQLDAFRVVKRRREWLLGRWTAKHLIRHYLAQSRWDGLGGEIMAAPLPALVVLADPVGAPYAAVDPRLIPDVRRAPLGLVRLPISLSISHSGDRAFCAVLAEPGMAVGVDIERIEPREPGFGERFLTPDEVAGVRAAPVDVQDRLLTAIWSAKEAALKALRVGLRVDTRWVECRPAEKSHEGWAPVQITCDAALLRMHPSSVLTGWWCCEDDFALALVVLHSLVQRAPQPVHAG